jgi:hypothetical protein
MSAEDLDLEESKFEDPPLKPPRVTVDPSRRSGPIRLPRLPTFVSCPIDPHVNLYYVESVVPFGHAYGPCGVCGRFVLFGTEQNPFLVRLNAERP